MSKRRSNYKAERIRFVRDRRYANALKEGETLEKQGFVLKEWSYSGLVGSFVLLYELRPDLDEPLPLNEEKKEEANENEEH